MRNSWQKYINSSDIIIIIIIIIIISYHHYIGYLQLCTWNKTYFWSLWCNCYSVIIFYVTCNIFLPENVLYFYIRTFWGMCSVSSVATCCNSLTSCFPSMFLRYFLNDFELVPVTPVNIGVTFVFIFHIHWISTVRNLHDRILTNHFLITFLSREIATSINILSTNRTAIYSHEPTPCCKQNLQWKKALGSVKYNYINNYIYCINSTG